MRAAVVKAMVVLAGAATLGACSSIKDTRGYLVDQPLLDSVQPGIDNRQSVERTLGRERTFLEDLFGNIGTVGTGAGGPGGGPGGPNGS